MNLRIPVLSIPVLTFLIASCHHGRIKTIDNVWAQGQDSYQVNTGQVVYLYQKEAGAFSSVIDREGIDWVQFKVDIPSYPASASASYRGIPNLVFGSEDHGTGHPGFKRCSSRWNDPCTIRTVSNSGKWEWTWEFHKDYAVMNIEKSDPGQPFWFLYEGPAGGAFQPHRQYWGTDRGGPWKDIPDYFLGQSISDQFQWFYFGDENIDRVMFIAQVEPDRHSDLFAYLGNSTSGVISPDGMIVAGFGRDKNAKPLLTGQGFKFIIGFFEEKIISPEIHARLSRHIQGLIKEY